MSVAKKTEQAFERFNSFLTANGCSYALELWNSNKSTLLKIPSLGKRTQEFMASMEESPVSTKRPRSKS